MTDSDFDKVFGGRPDPRPSFATRVTQGQAFGGRLDPIAGMAIEAASEKPELGVYKAFGFIPAGTVNQSCEVRTWVDGTDVPDGVVFFYRLLMQIAFTSTTELRLMLPDTIIVLTGQNLEPLRLALTRQHATYVQQHSRLVWPLQVPQGEILIERIEIVRP
ncbi:hypothetical protein [Caulobacter sp. DWP3-1-3b2]|uniref:hypothetical protein n=1 Tax=Caulobacter sp. DWP3-1-3b2 TaxID=2804643 RepID=UPI003CF15861